MKKVPYYYSEFFTFLSLAVSFLQHLETKEFGERFQFLSNKALSFCSNP
jgi:hypothetical protein